MDISIIVPSFNERESLPELCGRISNVMQQNRYSYELIIVDDGSTDNSWDCITDLAKENSAIHGIRFRRNYGKSGALYCGFKKAQGDVVITMDADLQDFPEEIPALFRMITEEGYDLVSGWKHHRQDNALTKNLPSKLYNATARRITGIKLHDMNCGLKAYRQEVVKNIEVYGEMHRIHEDRREASPTHKAQIRQKQVRYREIHKRLSGPAVTMVSKHIRKETYALLRIQRITDVLHRICHDSVDYRHQACPSGAGRAFPPGDGPAALLSCLASRHSGRHALPCRIPWRDDSQIFRRAKPVQHQRRILGCPTPPSQADST